LVNKTKTKTNRNTSRERERERGEERMSEENNNNDNSSTTTANAPTGEEAGLDVNAPEIDLSGDGGVLKKILRAGTGEKAKDGYTAVGS